MSDSWRTHDTTPGGAPLTNTAALHGSPPTSTMFPARTWGEWLEKWKDYHNKSVGFNEWEIRTEQVTDHDRQVTHGAIYLRSRRI